MSTLDARVHAKVASICNAQAQIPMIRNELLQLRNELAGLDLRQQTEAYMATQDNIAGLEAKLHDLQTADVDYLLQAMPYVKESARRTAHTPGNALDKMFGKFVKMQTSSKRGNILNKYLLHVEKDEQATLNVAMNRSVDTMCHNCPDVPLQMDPHLCMLACPECGLSRQYLENSESNLTYDQEQHMQRVTLFSYKRSNHLTDWLNSVSGRENTEIATEVLDALKTELKKDKVKLKKDITPVRIKRYLKKLKLTNMYEHATYITQLLGGQEAPQFSPELEEKLQSMFTAIQEPFDRLKVNRSNILSYSYLLHKMCELLGEDWALPHFHLLKCPTKQKACDQIWEKICKELRWQFIPSI